jgi:hypothetical protein
MAEYMGNNKFFMSGYPTFDARCVQAGLEKQKNRPRLEQGRLDEGMLNHKKLL